MFRNKRLAFKLSVAILSAVILIFSSIGIYNYIFSRKLVLRNVQENTKNLTSSAINKSEGFFKIIEKVVLNISYIIRDNQMTFATLDTIITDMVRHNEEIYGSTVAFAPYQFKSDLQYYAPYFYKKGEKLLYENLAHQDYFYPVWEWYRKPIAAGKPLWSEPYYDEGGGNILMSTFSVPFYKKHGNKDSLYGVITADVSLDWLQSIVSQIKIFDTGFAFLISQKGTIIAHPDSSLVMNESIFSLADKLQDENLKRVGQQMIKGQEDFVPIGSELAHGKCWVYFSHLKNNNWSLAFVFPEKELYADLYRLNRILFILALVGIAMMLVLIILISNRITRPLHKLALAAEGFGKGNFDVIIPPSISSDEVGTLKKSFSQMQKALKDYIQDLKNTTSAKEKIESELKIARDIQMGIIPRKFPAFPDRKEFNIHGFIQPAKEVGGDLYDFFFIDNERLCFAIGDVSGKGTPAALFMAVTTTIMRAEAQIAGLTAGEIIGMMNNYLCCNNDSSLFVTLFLGILNTSTGEIQYVNAGHNYPFIIKKDGTVIELDNNHCIPLGIQSDISCQGQNYKLNMGDVIFLYTDGVSEAFNRENEQFSIKSIYQNLQRKAGRDPEEIIDSIVAEVKDFSSGTEQSDDISVLAIKFNGTLHDVKDSGIIRISLANSLQNLSGLASQVEAICSSKNIPFPTIQKVNLVLEELISNTIMYGYNDGQQHEITIDLTIEGETIGVIITDDADEFNPLESKDPDISSEIKDRKIGGLGIHLVKNMASQISYNRKDGKNIIHLLISNN